MFLKNLKNVSIFLNAAAVKASLVNSVSAPSGIKISTPCKHPVRGTMIPSVRAEETVSVAGASATLQKAEEATMVTSASVMMNTVRSFRINYVEVLFVIFNVCLAKEITISIEIQQIQVILIEIICTFCSTV